jgi:Fic family protein
MNSFWTEYIATKREYLTLNLQDVIDYEKFCIISIVWHSTKIEGCSLNETDTRVLLENDIAAGGKPLKDHLMVTDHFAAFQFIKEEARLKRKISIPLIREIGGLVMKNTGSLTNTISGQFDTSKGDLRLAQVYVEKKYFPDFQKVPILLEALCKSTNERLDTDNDIEILKLSADIHYNFVNIHPYGDGNGRAARLLMNYVQLYHNEPLIKIFTEDRAQYIDALNETEEKQNPEIFREFIAKQQIKFFKTEIEKYNGLQRDFTIVH